MERAAHGENFASKWRKILGCIKIWLAKLKKEINNTIKIFIIKISIRSTIIFITYINFAAAISSPICNNRLNKSFHKINSQKTKRKMACAQGKIMRALRRSGRVATLNATKVGEKKENILKRKYIEINKKTMLTVSRGWRVGCVTGACTKPNNSKWKSGRFLDILSSGVYLFFFFIFFFFKSLSGIFRRFVREGAEVGKEKGTREREDATPRCLPQAQRCNTIQHARKLLIRKKKL